jgi:hypothetical protein
MNASAQTTNAFAVAGTNDIRAIKPPVPVAGDEAWMGWLILALAVAMGMAALLWFLLRKAAPRPLPPEPAAARARRRLSAARALIDQPRPFCIAISDSLRAYLEERFDFRAPERTTEEFMAELRASPLLNAGQKHSLGLFLEQCDLAKFARHEPARPELESLHAAALRLVTETESLPAEAAPPIIAPPTLDPAS